MRETCIFFVVILCLNEINSASLDFDSTGEDIPTNVLSPPEKLRHAIKIGTRFLNSAGATNPYSRAVTALQLPALSMWENATIALLMEIRQGLKYVFQTETEYTMGVHGSGIVSMTTVLDNLIEPGDKVLIADMGHWGPVFSTMSENFGGKVVRIQKSPGSVFSLDEIDTAMEEHKPDVFIFASGESSTGAFQPLKGVGDLCHKHGCITISDTIATVCIQRIGMDEYKIDAVFMNAQKGCAGVAGMSAVAFSQRAIEKYKRRKVPPFIYHTNLARLSKAWFIGKELILPKDAYTHSISVPLLYMFREMLAYHVDEGIENVWRRHQEVNDYFRKNAAEMGFTSFNSNEKDVLVGTNVFTVPANKDVFKLQSYMIQRFGIEISAGMGPTLGKVIRVGIFGSSANQMVVKTILSALKDALASKDTDISNA